MLVLNDVKKITTIYVLRKFQNIKSREFLEREKTMQNGKQETKPNLHPRIFLLFPHIITTPNLIENPLKMENRLVIQANFCFIMILIT